MAVDCIHHVAHRRTHRAGVRGRAGKAVELQRTPGVIDGMAVKRARQRQKRERANSACAMAVIGSMCFCLGVWGCIAGWTGIVSSALAFRMSVGLAVCGTLVAVAGAARLR